MPSSVPVNGSLVTTSAAKLELTVRVSATTPREYVAVVVSEGLTDLRGGLGTVGAPTLTWSGGSRRITGSLGDSFTWCSASTLVSNPDMCPGLGNQQLRCTQQQTWQPFTALTKAVVDFGPGGELELAPRVAPTAALATRPWPADIADSPKLPSYSWSTAETGLPSCTPSAAGCPPAP